MNKYEARNMFFKPYYLIWQFIIKLRTGMVCTININRVKKLTFKHQALQILHHV